MQIMYLLFAEDSNYFSWETEAVSSDRTLRKGQPIYDAIVLYIFQMVRILNKAFRQIIGTVR